MKTKYRYNIGIISEHCKLRRLKNSVGENLFLFTDRPYNLHGFTRRTTN